MSILILAGNKEEFENFINKNISDEYKKQFLYVTGIDYLIHRDFSSYQVIGSFLKRSDSRKIMDYIHTVIPQKYNT